MLFVFEMELDGELAITGSITVAITTAGAGSEGFGAAAANAGSVRKSCSAYSRYFGSLRSFGSS